MKINWLTFSLLALSIGIPSSTKAIAAGIGTPAPGSFYADGQRDWENPPEEFREIQRQGYHDGIEGARKDFDNHRRPDVNNREEYRHPHIEASAREDYREGFRRGYETATDHLMNVHDHDYDHH
jgi:hypothetical protein